MISSPALLLYSFDDERSKINSSADALEVVNGVFSPSSSATECLTTVHLKKSGLFRVGGS